VDVDPRTAIAFFFFFVTIKEGSLKLRPMSRESLSCEENRGMEPGYGLEWP
jgi:hypothetical protein